MRATCGSEAFDVTAPICETAANRDIHTAKPEQGSRVQTAHTVMRVLAVGQAGRTKHTVDAPNVLVSEKEGSPQWYSLIHAHPLTGRTHQIRVHLSSAGLPLVGDTVYGRARGNDARLGRPALHAAHLGFEHPIHGRRLVFDTRLPDDLLEWIADLGPEEAVE